MTRSARTFALVTALLGWFAVIAQFYLAMQLWPIAEGIARFFGYFTILTNIIVAARFTFLAGGSANFFSRPGTQTAITVYIIVVGAVYNLFLRFLWQPQGLQKLVDELLHSVVPVLCIVYWIVYVPKTNLQWKDSPAWLAFPIAYIAIIAVAGAVTGYYPYPFINVAEIGYPQALLNAFLLMLVFMGLSLFLIAVAKWLTRKQLYGKERADS